MRKLNYELKQLCQRNKDGSFSTQANRERNLSLIAKHLDALGYKKLEVHNLKLKHVSALVNKWQDEEVGVGTIKNRMSHIRWWAEKINKSNMIPKSNDYYGIEKRKYVTNENKATEIDNASLGKILNKNIKMSVRLQQFFGFRRKEAIMFNASEADKGDYLLLKDTWTKGGRPREVPILNQAQRDLIDEVKVFTKGKSLIPTHKNYIQQVKTYENAVTKAGLHKNHGLRHAYAQKRYHELTGWLPPAAGGKHSRELSPEEKQIDRNARLLISQELGHEREQITAVYLGR